MRKFVGDRLVLATHNAAKVEEITALLAPYSIAIQTASSLGLLEPVETEDSFVGNARIKAHAAALSSGLPALADDSGVSVDVLGGAPGVYTADWAETPNGRDYGIAMQRTWDAIVAQKLNAPFHAQFRCTLVLAWPDGHDEVFEGIMNGEIVWPMRGSLGHGYDPIFQPAGQSATFAEMDPKEKNLISHRANALAALVDHCFT